MSDFSHRECKAQEVKNIISDFSEKLIPLDFKSKGNLINS